MILIGPTRWPDLMADHTPGDPYPPAPPYLPWKMIVFQNIGASNQIFIHTDKQQYYAGEEVTGQVMLSVATALQVDSINIKLSGFEHAEFDYQVTRTRTSTNSQGQTVTSTYTETRHASETNTVYRRKYVLYACRSTLVGGNFCFPFKIRLDHNIPGTFDFYGGGFSNTQANVKFEIRAEVQVPGFFEPNLKHYQDILICQPLKREIMSSDTYKEAKVTFLCCIPKGQVSLSAAIDKNAYAPGEQVMLSLIVDNSQSQVDLETFSFKLERNIILHANGQSHYKTDTIVKSKVAGVPKGDRAERVMAVNLPHRTEPSTDGRLVKCSYQLIVELHVPWSPNVKTKTPVQIFAAPIPTYSAVLTMPPGWAPQVMPMVDLTNLQYQAY